MEMQGRKAAGEGRSRVLVVDEGAAGLDSAQAILASEFDVTSVADATQAMALLIQQSFDAVCADQASMGAELLGRAARLPRAPTGVLLADPADLGDELAGTPQFQVLLKPFEPQLLIDTVQRACALARMGRRL